MSLTKSQQNFIDSVVSSYLSEIKIPKRRTKNLYIIAPVGLIGSGKSTVGTYIARKIGAQVVSSNYIRGRFFKPKKKEYHIYTQPVLEKIVESLLEKGVSVVLDRDNVDGKVEKKYKKILEKYRAKVVYIRVVCDIDVMIERMMKRKYNKKEDIITSPAVAIREMWRRTPLHYRWIIKPWPRFEFKDLKYINFKAVLDTTDGKTWKKKADEIRW